MRKDVKKIPATKFLGDDDSDIVKAWLRELCTHFDNRNYTTNHNVI